MSNKINPPNSEIHDVLKVVEDWHGILQNGLRFESNKLSSKTAKKIEF